MVQVIRHATLEGAGWAITFTNRLSDPAAAYVLTGLDGWYGGVGVKGDDAERPLGHGLFPTPSTRTGRAMTLRAMMLFGNQHDRELAARDLSGVLGDGELGTLTAGMDGLELVTYVKLDGEVKVAFNGLEALDVEIPLRAPDPFLYGDTSTFNLFPAGFGEGMEYALFATGGILTYGDTVPDSSVALHNRGNAEAWPVFVVRGNFPAGVRIISGSNTVEVRMPIYEQSPVIVDMASGSVMVNGSDQTYRVTKRQWFSVPPRSAIQPRVTGIEYGDGWADVRVSDTFL